jgi:histidinol phosphatase-like PHP family hydrolase
MLRQAQHERHNDTGTLFFWVLPKNCEVGVFARRYTMKLQIDHHIHSKYSACCRGNYDFHDIFHRLHEQEMLYYCVTDHVHSDADSGGLRAHHEVLQRIPDHLLDRPVYIGVEVTFNTGDGEYSSAFRANAPQPAYVIGGGHHIPNTDVSMWSIPRAIEVLQQCDDHALTELFACYHNMQCGAVKNRTIDILAHPHDLFFRCGIFDIRQLEMFAATARLCRRYDVAVEVNRASIIRCAKADNAGYVPANRHCIRPNDFYTRMIQLVLDEGGLLSPASDAHALDDVGKLDKVEEFMTGMGIQDDQLLYLNQKC